MRSDRDPMLGIASDDADDVFVWEGGDSPAERRLPAELVGFELVKKLKEALCRFGASS